MTAASESPHPLQFAIWARLEPATKWALAVADTRMLVGTVRAGIRLRHPHASGLEIADKSIRHTASSQS